MKYIKTFENLNLPYCLVDLNFLENCERIDFLQGEVGELKLKFDVERERSGYSYLIIKIKGLRCGTIYKYIDEWYVVKMNQDKMYKCDQFDGLVQCIADRLRINSSTVWSKLFENNSTESYSYIDPDKIPRESMIPFSKDERDKIAKKYKVAELNPLYSGVEKSHNYLEIMVNSRIAACCYKMDDEWYYATIKPNGTQRHDCLYYYNCDQMIGLLECLDDFISP